MNQYEQPILRIVCFSPEDCVRTSGELANNTETQKDFFAFGN